MNVITPVLQGGGNPIFYLCSASLHKDRKMDWRKIYAAPRRHIAPILDGSALRRVRQATAPPLSEPFFPSMLIPRGYCRLGKVFLLGFRSNLEIFSKVYIFGCVIFAEYVRGFQVKSAAVFAFTV